MAIDMFLKLAGIPGESKDSKHKDEIDIFSYSWGVSQLDAQGGGGAAGGGAGAGKASFQDFNFLVPVSKASPKLFLACASGQHVPDATLTIRRSGEFQVEFLVYKLNDIQVTSFQESASSGEDRPVDSFSINYGKIEISYKEQNEKGGVGSETTAGWDLKANKGT
jgi:type VI secretion system secreted protein Hcp